MTPEQAAAARAAIIREVWLPIAKRQEQADLPAHAELVKSWATEAASDPKENADDRR